MNQPKCNGYTLMELLIVVLVVSILAGAMIPLMHGRVDESKWTEGITAAGLIRNAARACYAQTGAAPVGRLNEPSVLSVLGIRQTDLTGRFFVPGDYEILCVDDKGRVVVRVTGSLPQAPTGSKILTADGRWE